MKTVLLILVLSNFVISKCYLQNTDYGIVIESNLTSHTNSDPTKPEDGQFQWNSLTTFGAGMYASKLVTKHIIVSSALLFRQRGYTEETQIGVTNSPISQPSLQNRFNYISLEAICKYVKSTSSKIKLSPILGVSLNTLVSRNIESERINLINDVYPVNQYQDNWKKINLNYLIGFSVYRLNKYSLDFAFNRSVTPLLKVETLLVKDWTWSMKLNVSI